MSDFKHFIKERDFLGVGVCGIGILEQILKEKFSTFHRISDI